MIALPHFGFSVGSKIRIYQAQGLVLFPTVSNLLAYSGRLSCRLWIYLALLFFVGCSPWAARDEVPTAQSNPFRTQALRARPGTSRFELGIAQLDQDQLVGLEQAWLEFDEQAIDVNVRRWWDRNGLRIAIVSSQIPESLLKLVAPREVNEDYLDEFQLQLHRNGMLDSIPRLVTLKEIGIRPSDPKWVACSNPLPFGHWHWENEQGAQSFQGEAVQAGFLVSSQIRGDGNVAVKLVPRIAYGAPKPSLGISQLHLALEHKQDELLLWDLAIEVTLLPGQTLIATSNYDETWLEMTGAAALDDHNLELGQLFFETLDNQSANYLQPGPRLLLLRLLGSVQDDLYQNNVAQ